MEIYNRAPINFSNWDDEEEQNVTLTTTEPPKLDIKSQEDVDRLNQFSEGLMSGGYNQFTEPIPLSEVNPIGGTADYETTVTDTVTPIFSSGSWYGAKYLMPSPLVAIPYHAITGFPKVARQRTATTLEGNYTYLNDYIAKNSSSLDKKYVEAVFSGLSKPLTLADGTEVYDIDQAMSDPKNAGRLLKQATELAQLPEVKLNTDLKWKLEYNKAMHSLLDNTADYGHEIINRGLKYSAGVLTSDSKAKHEIFDYNKLLDANGNIISEKNYKDLLLEESKKRHEEYLKKNKDNFAGMTNGWSFIPPKNQSMSTSTRITGRFYNPITRRMEDSKTYEETNPVAAYEMFKQMESNYISKQLSEYKNRIKKLKSKYNDVAQAGVDAIRPQFEELSNPFNRPEGNRGGRLQSVPVMTKYNMNNDKIRNWDNMSWEGREYTNLVSATVDPEIKDKILYNIGSPKGTLPKKQDVELGAFFKDLYEKTVSGENVKSLLNPIGDITFQSIAGGDKNTHAYTIKLDNETIKKFKGTKDDPGPLYNLTDEQYALIKKEGITMYIPKSYASKVKYTKKDSEGKVVEEYINRLPAYKKPNEFSYIPTSLFAEQNKLAEDVTLFESTLYLNKPLVIDIPEAGKRVITYDKKKHQLKVLGADRWFNPNTRKYEESPIEEQIIEGAPMYDLNSFVGRFIMSRLKTNYTANMSAYNMLLQMQK